MKIKDLDSKMSLEGVKIKTPSGEIGYWVSQWQRGVWIRKKLGNSQVNPIFVEDLKEVLEWEVLEESINN